MVFRCMLNLRRLEKGLLAASTEGVRGGRVEEGGGLTTTTQHEWKRNVQQSGVQEGTAFEVSKVSLNEFRRGLLNGIKDSGDLFQTLQNLDDLELVMGRFRGWKLGAGVTSTKYCLPRGSDAKQQQKCEV